MEIFAGVVQLVAVADTGSFRGAARTLGVTPSAVSKAIARLEHQLGVRLVHRTSRVMMLTVEGEDAVAGFRDALERIRATRDAALAAQRTPSGRLRVTWPIAIAEFFADRVMPAMAAQHPQIEVSALVTDGTIDLVAENIDLAIRIGELGDSALVARRIGTLRCVTAAAPAYLARHGTPRSPGDLARHACLRLALPSGRIKTWQFHSATGAVAIVPAGRFTADHGRSLVTAAIAGLGIVQAHDLQLGEHLLNVKLVELLADHEAPGPPLYALCAPGRRTSPRVRAFLEVVADAFTQECARKRACVTRGRVEMQATA